MAESKPLASAPKTEQNTPQSPTKTPQTPERKSQAPVKTADHPKAPTHSEIGAYAAQQDVEGNMVGNEQEPEQPDVVGAFKAKEKEEKKDDEKVSYTNLELGEETNVSDWVVGMLSGRLQDWFLANMKWVGYYVDKGLDAGEKWFDKREEGKEKLGKDKDKDNKGKDKGNKDKDNKDKGNKDKGNKDKGNKDKGNKDKDNKRKPSQDKAAKAKAALDLAKSNASKRKYEDSALGKNQRAYDQMLIGSLEREAAYYQKAAENKGYPRTKEGRKAKAEILSDRKALTAMRKETGVNNKIVDGRSNRDKTKTSRPKVSLESVGLKAKDNRDKINNKTKQAQQKNKKKEGQKNRVKALSKARDFMNNLFNKKTQSRQQQPNDRTAVIANKKKRSR